MFQREIVLITSLDPRQVSEAIERRCEQKADGPQPIAALFRADAISQNGFKLQLLGERRSGSWPDLTGSIRACAAGSKVTAEISYRDAFSIVWSAGLVLAALVALGGARTLEGLPVRLLIFAALAAVLALY